MSNNELYIGLMSGTSADSLDAALVDFSSSTPLLLSSSSLPISPDIRQLVHRLAISDTDEINSIRLIDNYIADLSCSAIREACSKAGVSYQDIKAVGSHGQTIRHCPASSEQTGYTLQVGDPNIIAENSGITTIADFRRRDIAAGGQGAPLTPAFHNACFSSKETTRIILNLGGVANISVIPNTHCAIKGYDTGPANNLMDSWNQKHNNSPYDKDGVWANSGKVHYQLLAQLLSHSYFTQTIPKSTGREDFNLPWLEQQLLSHDRISHKDVQATLLQLTCESVAMHIDAEDPNTQAEIYICGGGAQNTALFNALKQRLQPRPAFTTAVLGVHPDWVEAMAFAWFAKQTLEKSNSNIPSVTGAKREVILGGIYFA